MTMIDLGLTNLGATEIALIAAAICIALEFHTGSFILLGIGLALICVAGLNFVLPDAPVIAHIVLFCAASVAFVAAFRWRFKQRHDQARAAGDVNEY